ncbi:uncharacterized protein LOC141607513 [Silene latifolia]|uniref:uncharacterized protein LOC141607513 n=1 Tax=Silene latifolia TaxID=37657 RepID=UPI003D787F29
MNCVSTVSYEVLFNGAPFEQFRPRYGLRQGDPLSPYLFILCMEVMSANVYRAQQIALLKGIELSRRSEALTHLFFADDSIFFLHDKNNSVEQLKDILVRYCMASGQVLNESKSGILFSPSTRLAKARKCPKVLKIKHNKGIGKYLGISTEYQSLKKSFFKGLVDNVMKRISSWNGLFLSSAGRLTLISSVLSNLSNFFLSVFKIPLIRQNLGWKPGINSDLNVWISPWVNGEIPCPNDNLIDSSNYHLANLKVSDPRHGNGSWNEAFSRDIFAEEWANKILAIPEKGSEKDLLRINLIGKKFCKSKLWRLPGPHIWRILVWKIITGTLPVGYEFMRRNMNVDQHCHFCEIEYREVESLEHLFRDCKIISRIWAGSNMGINVSNSAHVESSCFTFRIKIDASWFENLEASAGWVMYNNEGNMVFEGGSKFKAESASQAEALGIRKVLEWASYNRILHLEILTDCMQVLFQMAGIEKTQHLTKGVLGDISSLLPSFYCLCFSFVPRNLNKRAHSLATRAMRIAMFHILVAHAIIWYRDFDGAIAAIFGI